MKVNNVILTKHNLKEMVKSWESELSIAMGYQTQVVTDRKTIYAANESTKRLMALKERMNNLIAGL